jgi:hypothetical protein
VRSCHDQSSQSFWVSFGVAYVGILLFGLANHSPRELPSAIWLLTYLLVIGAEALVLALLVWILVVAATYVQQLARRTR